MHTLATSSGGHGGRSGGTTRPVARRLARLSAPQLTAKATDTQPSTLAKSGSAGTAVLFDSEYTLVAKAASTAHGSAARGSPLRAVPASHSRPATETRMPVQPSGARRSPKNSTDHSAISSGELRASG